MMSRYNPIGTVAAISLAAVFLATSFSIAAELKLPSGDVVLTVSGEITNTNGNDQAALDFAMLEALPITIFETTTQWTEGKTRFEGVLLSDLLDYVGATGSSLRAIALNDYAVNIPVVDENGATPLLAYKLDGEYFSVRDKGPLWVIYNFDGDAATQLEVYYSRSIWQLDRLVVEP